MVDGVRQPEPPDGGAAKANLLTMQGIVKHFPGARALDGVDLAIRAGEVHCLVGQNGAGKSTLIKVLSGAHHPDAGAITWRGEPLTVATPVAALRAGIATMYQELDVVDGLTVAENVYLGHELATGGFTQRRVVRACTHHPALREASGGQLVAEVDVLGDRQAVDDIELLVHRRDPGAQRSDGGGDGERLPTPGNGTRVRVVRTGQHLDQRRLAGTVLADQAVDLTGPDREVDTVECAGAREVLDDALHGEQVRLRRAPIGGFRLPDTIDHAPQPITCCVERQQKSHSVRRSYASVTYQRSCA